MTAKGESRMLARNETLTAGQKRVIRDKKDALLLRLGVLNRREDRTPKYWNHQLRRELEDKISALKHELYAGTDETIRISDKRRKNIARSEERRLRELEQGPIMDKRTVAYRESRMTKGST